MSRAFPGSGDPGHKPSTGKISGSPYMQPPCSMPHLLAVRRWADTHRAAASPAQEPTAHRKPGTCAAVRAHLDLVLGVDHALGHARHHVRQAARKRARRLHCQPLQHATAARLTPPPTALSVVCLQDLLLAVTKTTHMKPSYCLTLLLPEPRQACMPTSQATACRLPHKSFVAHTAADT